MKPGLRNAWSVHSSSDNFDLFLEGGDEDEAIYARGGHDSGVIGDGKARMNGDLVMAK